MQSILTSSPVLPVEALSVFGLLPLLLAEHHLFFHSVSLALYLSLVAYVRDDLAHFVDEERHHGAQRQNRDNDHEEPQVREVTDDDLVEVVVEYEPLNRQFDRHHEREEYGVDPDVGLHHLCLAEIDGNGNDHHLVDQEVAGAIAPVHDPVKEREVVLGEVAVAAILLAALLELLDVARAHPDYVPKDGDENGREDERCASALEEVVRAQEAHDEEEDAAEEVNVQDVDEHAGVDVALGAGCG